jgi:voltage-gated potassium channel Kch
VEVSVLLQTAIGSALLIFTVLVHSAFTLAVVSLFGGSRILHRHRERFVALATLVLMMFFASLIEASAWAITYVVIDAIPNLEKALYFSTVTFTTLGYGDITLNEDWRLLGAFEAANGSIMFGWTTALVVALVHTFFTQR